MPNFLFHCFKPYGVELRHNDGGFSESIMVQTGAADRAIPGWTGDGGVLGRRAVSMMAMAVAMDSSDSAKAFWSPSARSFHLACSFLLWGPSVSPNTGERRASKRRRKRARFADEAFAFFPSPVVEEDELSVLDLI